MDFAIQLFYQTSISSALLAVNYCTSLTPKIEASAGIAKNSVEADEGGTVCRSLGVVPRLRGSVSFLQLTDSAHLVIISEFLLLSSINASHPTS